MPDQPDPRDRREFKGLQDRKALLEPPGRKDPLALLELPGHKDPLALRELPGHKDPPALLEPPAQWGQWALPGCKVHRGPKDRKDLRDRPAPTPSLGLTPTQRFQEQAGLATWEKSC